GCNRRFAALHGAGAQAGVLRPSDSVHTHVLQMGSVLTSTPRREPTASCELRISSRGWSRMLPNDRWKKQGRTLPSASTTDETHGALHTLVGNSPSPFSAA